MPTYLAPKREHRRPGDYVYMLTSVPHGGSMVVGLSATRLAIGDEVFAWRDSTKAWVRSRVVRDVTTTGNFGGPRFRLCAALNTDNNEDTMSDTPLCCARQDRAGHRPCEDALVVNVRFSDVNTKTYSYFAPSHCVLAAGACLYVKSPINGHTKVRIVSVRPSTQYDRMKTISGMSCQPSTHSSLWGADDRISNTSNPEQPEATTMSDKIINITNITFVNGTDIKQMSNTRIISLFSKIDDEIEMLSKMQPVPKRFARRIEELNAQRAELFTLLDSIDEEDDGKTTTPSEE